MRFFPGTFSADEFYRFEFWAFVLLHVTLAVLIGLAFRHRENLAAAWQFFGLVLIWWLLALGAQYQKIWVANAGLPYDVAFLALQISVWARIAAQLVTVVLFALLFCLRHGKPGVKWLGLAILVSFLLHVMWSVFASSLWEDVQIDEDRLMMRETFWIGLTSWDVTLSWIIWYAFLFQKPAVRNVAPSP